MPRRKKSTRVNEPGAAVRLELTNRTETVAMAPYTPQAAAQELLASVMQAVIHEGKRFAATPEGQMHLEAMRRSPLVRNGRILWTMGSMDTLLERKVPPIPLHLLFPGGGTTAGASLEKYLSTLFQVDIDA